MIFGDLGYDSCLFKCLVGSGRLIFFVGMRLSYGVVVWSRRVRVGCFGVFVVFLGEGSGR